MKVGITGAGGFIGSHLVANLSPEEAETILFSGSERNVLTPPNAIIADISDFEKLKRNLIGTDRIVHLAAISSVRDSFENPAEIVKVNTLGTISLLNVCKELGIREIIIISSAEVYGNPAFNPVYETNPLMPISPYGVSKTAIEQMCFVYHKAYEINFKIIRPFSIYGPRMARNSIIYEIYNRIRSRKDVTLFNTTSIRDYCYIDDLIRAIKIALFSDFKGFEVYNIGTSIGTNSKELAELIQNIMKLSGEISEADLSDRPKRADVNHLVAEISKAKAELKWNPEITLEKGLRWTIKSFHRE